MNAGTTSPIIDFREKFGRLDGHATVTIDELAQLLCRTRRSVEVMRFNGQLPPSLAIPGSRRVCWLVGTIRTWLGELGGVAQDSTTPASLSISKSALSEQKRGPGRPRKLHVVF